MPVFACDECNTVENTALGHYWSRSLTDFEDVHKNGKALCSECTPATYADGSPTINKGGTWHSRFPKVQWDGKREMINRKET